MQHTHWHPSWWKEEYSSGWERIREAVRRDWQQTKHDLHMGGHELNQKLSDTMKQAEGKEPIPDINDPNPPKVIGTLDGEWEKVEHPMEYGFAAHERYGDEYPRWSSDLEERLQSDWDDKVTRRAWRDVRDHVRRGYERPSS